MSSGAPPLITQKSIRFCCFFFPTRINNDNNSVRKKNKRGGGRGERKMKNKNDKKKEKEMNIINSETREIFISTIMR